MVRKSGGVGGFDDDSKISSGDDNPPSRDLSSGDVKPPGQTSSDDQMRKNLPVRPEKPVAQPPQTPDEFVQASVQRWSQQSFAEFVLDGRTQLSNIASLSRPREVTILLQGRFRALLKERLSALMEAPQLLTIDQLEGMLREAAQEQSVDTDFIELFSQMSAVLSARKIAAASELEEQANQSNLPEPLKSGVASLGTDSAAAGDIASRPPQEQASAIEQLITAASSRQAIDSAAKILLPLAKREHMVSLPEIEGKAVFLELADAAVHLPNKTQQKLVESLANSFSALKHGSLQDFDVLLDAIRWTPDDAGKSWLRSLNLDAAVSSLPAPMRALAEKKALVIRVSRDPVVFSQLSPAKAREIFDEVVKESENYGKKDRADVIKTLFKDFAVLTPPVLEDFEVLLDAAAKILDDEGVSSFDGLQFGPAIAALPAAQQAEAVERLLAQPAAYDQRGHLLPLVAKDLYEFAGRRYLVTLPAAARDELIRVLGDASTKFRPGPRGLMNKRLNRADGSGESKPDDEELDSL